MGQDASLAQRMLSGGWVLLARQVLGALLGLAGLAIITTLIGARDYGVYVAAASLVMLAWMLVPAAIAATLVRRADEPDDAEWRAAALLMAAGGLAAMPVLAGAGWLVEHVTGIHGVAVQAAIISLGLPIAWPAQLAYARLERRLDYMMIARSDLAGQAASVGIAGCLGWAGAGPFAPSIGMVGQHLLGAWLLWRATPGFRPMPGGRDRLSSMLMRAWGWSAMSGSWHLRTLAAPAIVGSALGAAVLGQVALAQRVIETLSTARVSAARVAAAGIPQTLHDRERLRAIVGKGSTLVALATGAPTALACCVIAWMPWLVPDGWNASAAVLPGLATASTIGGLSVMWSSVLVAEGRSGLLTAMHLANACLLFAAAAALVPSMGAVGFAYADMIASSAFIISWLGCRARIGNPLTLGATLATTTCIALAWLPAILGR